MNARLSADQLLDQLFPDSPTGVPPGDLGCVDAPSQPTPTPAKPGIKRVGYSHAAMIDLILANPGISQNALAAHFGYSASWVSTIMSSDAFQSAFAERSAEIVDPSLRLTVEERFKGMVSRSMEILLEKLSLPAHQVPDQLALRAFELSSRCAGYGARQEPAAPQVNLSIHLEEMGSNLTRLLQREKAKVEALPLLEDSKI